MKLDAAETDGLREQGRLRIVIATIVINIVSVALLTFAPWSDWKTGLVLNLEDNLLLLGYVAWRRDIVLARFMVFGLAVGFTELAADAWLVDYTKTLDYSIGGGPMLWRSPIWMPIAWEIVAVQFGMVGLWLWERFGGWGLVAIGGTGRNQHPLLRRTGETHQLVAIPRLPHAVLYALLHYSRRIRHRHRAGDPGQATHTRQLDDRSLGRNRRRRGNLCVLCHRIRH